MKKIAAYVRVSTDEQAREGLSIDGQKNCIRKYCEMYFNNFEIDYYVDDGYSGRTTKRPKFKLMMKNITAYDYVCIWKLDRLSRSLVDAIHILKIIIKQKIELISVIERIDMSTAMGRAFVAIILIFAELEVENTSERTKMGLQQKCRNGEYPFSKSPFGYIMTDDRKLIPDPRTKKLINVIYEKYHNNQKNINSIVKEVEMMFDKFSFKQIEKICHRVLKNPIYVGKFEYLGECFGNVIKKPVVDEKNLLTTDYRIVKHKVHEYMKIDILCIKCGNKLSNATTLKQNGNEYKYKVCTNCKKRINEKKLESLILAAGLKYFKNNLNTHKDFVYHYNFDSGDVLINITPKNSLHLTHKML